MNARLRGGHWRIVTGFFVIAAAAQGCVQHAYTGPQLPVESIARLQSLNEQIATIDGRKVESGLYIWLGLLPGEHVLGVTQVWSNRHIEVIEVKATFEAGKTYTMEYQEHRPPPPPPTTRPFLEEMGGAVAAGAVAGAAEGVLWYTAPFWLPAVVVYEVAAERPKERPKGNWIEGRIRVRDVRDKNKDGVQVGYWKTQG